MPALFPSTQLNLASISDDLLVGADAISTFIYGSPTYKRRVYRLFERGEWPFVFRLGRRLTARKSTAIQYLADQERASLEMDVG